jgi:hypothetical protein
MVCTRYGPSAPMCGMTDRQGAAMMKEIVTVCLAIDAWTDAILPDEPFMVKASSANRSGLYERELDVVAQFRPGEAHARFEAEWTEEGWKFGRRIADA